MNPRIIKAENRGGLGLLLHIYVPSLSQALAAGFTKIRIDKKVDNEFVELTDSSSRIVLDPEDEEANVCLHTFSDDDGSVSDIYQVAYAVGNSVTSGPNSPEFAGSTVGYVSIAEALAAGVNPDLSVAEINDAILGEQEYIEQFTGSWFEPRAVEAVFSGNGNRQKHFSAPILQVDGLYCNDDFTTPLSPSEYLWFRPGDPRNHINPKITLTSSPSRSIFGGRAGGGAIFGPGVGNQKFVGVLGWVDDRGQAPYKMRQALVRLVVKSLSGTGLAGPDSSIQAGVLTKVQVKDHQRVYTPVYRSSTKAMPPTSMLVTGDAFVDGVLRHYKRAAQVRDGHLSFSPVR